MFLTEGPYKILVGNIPDDFDTLISEDYVYANMCVVNGEIGLSIEGDCYQCKISKREGDFYFIEELSIKTMFFLSEDEIKMSKLAIKKIIDQKEWKEIFNKEIACIHSRITEITEYISKTKQKRKNNGRILRRKPAAA